MVLRNSCVTAGKASRHSSDSIRANRFFTRTSPNFDLVAPVLRTGHRGDNITRAIRMESFCCTRLRSFKHFAIPNSVDVVNSVRNSMFALRDLTGMVVLAALLPALVWPQGANEFFRRGERSFDEHQLEAAIAAFQRSVELRPAYAPAWKALGVVYASRGEFERAEGFPGRRIR